MTDADFAVNLLKSEKIKIDVSIEKYLADLKKPSPIQPSAIHKAYDDAFNDVLTRGGKRLRGALAKQSYEMFSESATPSEIEFVALGIELFGTFLLVIDDADDRSINRRGEPTVHRLIEQFLQNSQYSGDLSHFGNMGTFYSAMSALSSYQSYLYEIKLEPQLVLKLAKSFTDTLLYALHGQLLEKEVSNTKIALENDVLEVHKYKTGYYTFFHPLQAGAIVAGVPQKEIQKLQEYALSAGTAFQLQDDILGMFGDDKVTGKPAVDDLREGKRTLLIVKALESANSTQRKLIMSALGNSGLTVEDANKVREIITETGSLEYNKQKCTELVDLAKSSFKENFTAYSETDQYRFFNGILDFIISREH